MTPTIRIEEDVYRGLQKLAKPFEDSPSSVIRGLLEKEGLLEKAKKDKQFQAEYVSGKKLNKAWNVNAKQAYYHKDGLWYTNLNEFPGAFFDRKGYVLFKTEEEYKKCSYLRLGVTTNLERFLSEFPNYVKMK